MVLESCQVRSLEIHGETDSLSKIDTPKLPESVLLNQSLSEYVAFHDFALESHIYIFKKATCNHYCIEYTVYHYYTLSICIVWGGLSCGFPTPQRREKKHHVSLGAGWLGSQTSMIS